MKPYRLVVEEPGLARVVDRTTGVDVGYVVQWARGWRPYLPNAERIPTAASHYRYRADAVERVWRAAGRDESEFVTG